jgi:hypothetical protein
MYRMIQCHIPTNLKYPQMNKIAEVYLSHLTVAFSGWSMEAFHETRLLELQ